MISVSGFCVFFSKEVTIYLVLSEWLSAIEIDPAADRKKMKIVK